MEEILFVNACVRGEQSRTLKLARHFLEQYRAMHPEDKITERNLMMDRLQPIYQETLAEEQTLQAAGRLDQPMFEPARQFAAADKVVIAAPFWELSFPAILKIYLERISVVGLVFRYDEQGTPVGLGRAKKLLLITTRGGDFSRPETQWMEMGARQLEALCVLYGIPQFQCLCAQGLDDVRNDPVQLLGQAMEQAEELAKTF
jgi:FMN-dependent NADH-azoreductase